jgi:glycosyltransferase involved in cell wall biosynthesis
VKLSAQPSASDATSAPPLEVAHFFSNFRTLGGVQSLLHQHYARDAEWGLHSSLVISDEAPGDPLPRVHFLRVSRWDSVHAVTRALRVLRQVPQPLVNIFHTTIPMRAYICKHDCAARRILLIHGKGAGLSEQIAARQTWLDAVICVNQESRAIAQRALPQLTAERFLVVPLPIVPCPGPVDHPPLAGRPMVLGYSGRLTRDEKRVDRLPVLCEQLQHLGLDYRLELLGEGPERASLQRQFDGNQRVQFLGRKSGTDYLRQLATWDFIVFTSDSEGQPVSLLEAMSGGVLPLFPGIGSGGDAYAEAVHPRLLYPAGDMTEAARRLSELGCETDSGIQRLRARSIGAVASNVDGSYFAQVAAFAREVAHSPRVSTDRFPWYPPIAERLPMAVAARLAALRPGRR